MLVTGKIEVFKTKKGYFKGIIKSFSKYGELTGKMYVDVSVQDDKIEKKCVDGKTLTIEVETGYLNVVHVELETESFDKLSVNIAKGKVVAIFPEEEKKTTKKKSTK